jgi:hypothetical protein
VKDEPAVVLAHTRNAGNLLSPARTHLARSGVFSTGSLKKSLHAAERQQADVARPTLEP